MGYLNSVISVIVKSNSFLPLHLYLVCICICIGLPVFDFLKILPNTLRFDVKILMRIWGIWGNDKSIKPVSLGFINVQCTVRFIKISFFSAILACILLVIEIYASLRNTNNIILERKGHQGDGFPIAICIKDRLNDTLWYSEWWKVATHYNLVCQWYITDDMHTALFEITEIRRKNIEVHQNKNMYDWTL